MKLSEYTSFDALGLAELVRKREVTPAELVEAAYAAVEQVNPALNAVIASLREDAARTIAAGIPDGPFAGVPFLVKDLVLMVAGAPTTMGSRLFQGFVAPIDCELMARYRRAGLLAIGKTNTPEMGLNVATEPVAHGPTRNPWRPELSPGGSSGGSAAAVAARITPMAHANDAAGSIRIPASCCGLFGLKPTRARTPAGPIYGEMVFGIAVEHAVTRSVRDSAALLDATAGADAGAPYFPPAPPRPYLEEARTPPGRLRIALSDQTWNGAPVSAECKEALRRAAGLCEELGHEVVPAQPGFDGGLVRAGLYPLLLAYSAYLVDKMCPMFGLNPGPDTLEATNLTMAAAGQKLSASDMIAALSARDMLSRQVGQFFSQFDVLLTPTLSSPALSVGAASANDPSHGAEAWLDHCFRFAPFTPPFNLSGNPAMSVPLHWTEEGVPVGAHFVGRYGDEATLFRLAGQLEQAAPWQGRRPAICAG